MNDQISRIKSLNKALTDIDVQLPPKQYIKNIMKSACDNLNYLFGTVIEIDDIGDAHMVVSHNLPENYPEMVNKVSTPIFSGPAGEAFETGKIIVLHDPFSDPRLEPWKNLRIITGVIEIIIWVPLFKNGKVFGIYVLYSEKDRVITQDELSSLEQIGVMVSIAITSNKYLNCLDQKTQELQKARDELEIRVRERTIELSNANTELQLFKDLINQSNDDIFVVDPKTSRFLEINDRTCTTLGLTREKILNMGVTDLKMFKDSLSWDNHVKEIREKGSLRFEREFKKRDHPTAIVEINVKYIVHEKNDYMVAIMRDITERKNVEKILQNYAKELHHSNELKNLFEDVLHHDLLNPAGIIKGYTEVLLDTEQDKNRVQALKVIKRNTEKLITLVETASKLAKLESVDDIEFHRVDLCDILKDTIDDFEPEFDQKQITINFIQKNDCFVNVNPLVKEVFVNLLSNAIKYRGNENKIVIDISDTDMDWIIAVTDFGIGISDKDKPHLFERFKRADKHGIKGMGLGLAIVKRIIDLHEGRVGVDNNPKGHGSVFWVTLKKA